MKIQLLALTLLLAAPLYATRYYVNAAATGNGNGLSWANAFTDLQKALQPAIAGDEIWVAKGNYLPTTTADRTISFRPADGVRIFGGFAGTETSLEQRDWESNPSILSGQIGTPLITDNSYHIMCLSKPDSNTVLDGLTFQYGNAFGSGLDDNGSAILIADSTYTAVIAPRIRNCRFLYNQAKNNGGAIGIFGFAADYSRFENCYFQQNKAAQGGAITLASNNCNAEFLDCFFLKNEVGVGSGGAVSGQSGSLRFERCRFEENEAKRSGGAVYTIAGTGGLAPMFADCLFLRNRTTSGEFVSGDGNVYVLLNEADSFVMTRCQFIENKSTGSTVSPGLVLIPGEREDVTIRITDCIFERNESSGTWLVRVPDIKNQFRSMDFQRCRFSGDKCSSIALSRTSFGTTPLTVRIDSCLFENIDNNAGVLRLGLSGNSSLSVRNSRLQGNNGARLVDASAVENHFANCIFENNQGHGMFVLNDNNYRFDNCVWLKNKLQFLMFEAFEVTMTFANCQFDSNVTAKDGAFPFYAGKANIYNSVFQNNNGTPLGIPQYANPHFEHCFFDSIPANLSPKITFGPGNLTGIDPQFADPAAGDFRLLPCSPLVHAGDNDHAGGATDLEGNPRIAGGRVDIGVYETEGPTIADEPIVAPSCNADSSGIVAVQPSGGCPPYTISWTTSDGQTGENLTGLASGEYVFTIADTRGSEYQLPLTVPPPVSLQALATPVQCGDTLGGSAGVNILNGTSPFTYQWSDGDYPDSLRAGLAARAYMLTVTDANGCSAVAVVDVEKQGILNVTIQVGEISCPGAADGSFTVLPNNGKAPFTWLWDDGSTAPTLAPIGPGDYVGALTDALGCTIGWTLPLDEPKALQANPQVTHATDSVLANGKVTLMPSGGTAPFEALWITGAVGLDIGSLAPGVYTVTLTDAHGCTVMETMTVGVTVSTNALERPEILVRLFPNPTTGFTVLEGYALEAGLHYLAITDAAGRTVKVLDIGTPIGAFRVVIPLAGLPEGIYAWLFQAGAGIQAGKIIIR